MGDIATDRGFNKYGFKYLKFSNGYGKIGNKTVKVSIYCPIRLFWSANFVLENSTCGVSSHAVYFKHVADVLYRLSRDFSLLAATTK
jgi:hypothetical protein